jgi:hypothetical protein
MITVAGLEAGSRDNLPPPKPAPLLALRQKVAGGNHISKLFRVRACARARMFHFQPATCHQISETRINTGFQRWQVFFQSCHPAATSKAQRARLARKGNFVFLRKWLFSKEF